jgi:cellulose synthase/poly-beta-1,6-N-acetylglucosamine synthase-like glycosyltransferase
VNWPAFEANVAQGINAAKAHFRNALVRHLSAILYSRPIDHDRRQTADHCVRDPLLQRTSGHSQHTLTLLGDINKLKKAKAISPNSYVLLVDDGNTDRTWDLIEKISNAQPKRVRALKLSRNVGHQNALLAGLLAQIGKADAVISLDADLQDDMSVVLKMIDNFNGGAEIVFAVRKGALLTAALSAAQRTSTIAFSIGSAPISFRTMPISA